LSERRKGKGRAQYLSAVQKGEALVFLNLTKRAIFFVSTAGGKGKEKEMRDRVQ